MGVRPSLPRRRRMAVVLGVALVAASLGASGAAAAGGTAQVVHGAVRLDQVGYASQRGQAGLPPRRGSVRRSPVLGGRRRWQDGALRPGRPAHRRLERPLPRGAPARLQRAAPGRAATGWWSMAWSARPHRRSASPAATPCSRTWSTTPSRFFQAQRDGADVPALLDRRPSHLADRRATVYDTPVFSGDRGDVPAAPLQADRRPHRRGGRLVRRRRLRQVHPCHRRTRLAEMLVRPPRPGAPPPRPCRRDPPRPALAGQDVGFSAARSCTSQVGIGTGSEEFGFVGDHDVWRLPEADDALVVQPGDEEYYIKHRPVFGAARARPADQPEPGRTGGRRVRPRRAGGGRPRPRARPSPASPRRRRSSRWPRPREVGELVTAFPHAYYPEDSWQDDMEFGAVELALAASALHDRRAAAGLRAATHWARQYLGSDHLGRAQPLRHQRARPRRPCPRTAPRPARVRVRGHRRRPRRRPAAAASIRAPDRPDERAVRLGRGRDPVRRGHADVRVRRDRRAVPDGSPATATYDAFGTQQRNWALGANAWGTIATSSVRARYSRTARSTRSPTSPAASPGAATCWSARSSTVPTVPRTSRTSASRTAREGLPGRRGEPLCRLRPAGRPLPRRRPGLAERGAGDRLHLHRDARLGPRGRPLSSARRRGGYRRRRERTRRSTAARAGRSRRARSPGRRGRRPVLPRTTRAPA